VFFLRLGREPSEGGEPLEVTAVRSLWKGSISFGLVNIPVRLYAAIEEKSVRFNLLHRECRTPIKYQKICPHCGREVSQDEIVKGYPYDRGRYVILDDEDFENLPVPTARQVQILDFTDLAEIDPVYYDRTYYLEPDEGAEKPYALLRRAMVETRRVAIAKVALRSRESLACVRVYHQALVMETMYYPDEIRSIERLRGIAQEPPLSEREVAMATQLVENLTDSFDPGKYRDEYREALLALIERKVQGEAVEPAPAPPVAGKVIDLMEALEASLKATARRTGDQDGPIRTKPTTRRQAAKAKGSKGAGTGS